MPVTNATASPHMIKQQSGREWDAIIARTFAAQNGAALSMFAFTIDAEYLEYVDQALSEIRAAGAAGSAPGPLDEGERMTWRGAAVETIMAGYLARRGEARNAELPAAINGGATVISQVVALGLARRFDRARRDEFVPIFCPVSDKVTRELDAFLRDLIGECVSGDDVPLLLGDALPDLRSAIVEAALAAWLVWRDAEPSRTRHAFPGEATW